MTILIDTPQNASPPDFFIRFQEKVRRETQRPRTPEERRKIQTLLADLRRNGESIAAEARHLIQTMRRLLWRGRGNSRTHRAQRTPQSHKTDSGPGGDPDPEPRRDYIYSLTPGGAA